MDAADGAFKLPTVPGVKEPKSTAVELTGGTLDTPEDSAVHVDGSANAPVAVRQGETIQVDEPNWCTIPPANTFAFSIIRNGVVIDSLKLEGKARFLVGRKSEEASAACDIAAEHPSCSRNHAVLFYGEKPGDAGAGFYLVDLNSAHGTLVNKVKLAPGTFYRLECGYVVKFGASTRILVLEGPPSSTLADASIEDTVLVTKARNGSQQSTRITWGMADADDDDTRPSSKRQRGAGPADQTSLSANTGDYSAGIADEPDTEEEQLITDPIELEERAAYYRSDPKAILAKWFDVMGYEMDVTVDEQNAGTKAAKYMASLELPYETFDGIPLTASAVSIRKKEAVHQACLDACRLLDMRRALRETIQNGPVGGGESERVRRAKRLAANDYYDDDEDAFFDRTDELQIKRTRRMQRDAEAAAGAAADHSYGAKAETFESLQLRFAEVEREIADLNAKLERDNQLSKPTTSNAADETAKSSSTVDALDAFIAGLRDGVLLDPKEKSKAKQRLAVLRGEQTKLKALIELTRPALPLLPKVHFTSLSSSSSTADAVVLPSETPDAHIGDTEFNDSEEQTSSTSSASEAAPNHASLLPQKQPEPGDSPSPRTASVFDSAESTNKEVIAKPRATQPAGGNSIRFQQKHGGKIQAPLPEPGMRAPIGSVNNGTKKHKVHSITTRIMQASAATSNSSKDDDDAKYDLWIPPTNAEKTSL